MPLKDPSLQAKRTTNTFEQKHGGRAGADVISRTGTPSQARGMSRTRSESISSNSTSSANPLGARDVPVDQNDRRHALSMKMIPATIRGPRPANDAERSDASNVAAIPSGWAQGTYAEAENAPQSVFDNTESLNFDDDFSMQDSGNRTMVFRGGASRHLPTYPEESRSGFESGTRRHLSGGDDETTRHFQNVVPQIPDNWQDVVTTEKELQAQEHHRMDNEREEPLSLKHYDARSSRDITEFTRGGGNQTIRETPSRSKTAPLIRSMHMPAGPKNVSFDSPGIRSRDLARADSPDLEAVQAPTHAGTRSIVQETTQGNGRRSSMAEFESIPANKNVGVHLFSKSKLGQQPAGWPYSRPRSVSALNSSRESDCPTSEDEISENQPGPQTTHASLLDERKPGKRPREEDLDHDTGVLKVMTFRDLDDEKFVKDPRDVANHDSFDAQGHPIGLSQRLQNLGKMSQEEQQRIFRRQSDEEWSQTGLWFIEKFQEDLERVIKIRAERRKISLRFEDEIRRRQRSVECSIAGIDDELKSLKKGGGDLIRGRNTPSRQNTPRKS